MRVSSYDIIIVGGGVVGKALALMLAQQTSFKIAVLERTGDEKTWQQSLYHHRVSALTLSSKRLFENLGVWQAIKDKRLSPFTQIEVWDDSTQSAIQFDCQEIAEPTLGYIVENNLLLMVLTEALQHFSNVHYISPLILTQIEKNADGITLIDSNGHRYQTHLAIAADGANSWLCQKIPIKQIRKNYQQQAIVATVTTELAHHKRARQVFLPTGPLAFLPLAVSHLSSIVWSTPTEEAKRLMALNPLDFQTELGRAFSFKLGIIKEVGSRFSFPLYQQEAENYIAPRFALVGDTAHVVHPLAGLGVNMGLLDAASLAEILSEAHDAQRDFTSSFYLRRYERWRKADNAALQKGIHLLKIFFADEKKSLQKLRATGLSFVNQSVWLKNKIIQQAVGNRSGLPKLATKV